VIAPLFPAPVASGLIIVKVLLPAILLFLKLITNPVDIKTLIQIGRKNIKRSQIQEVCAVIWLYFSFPSIICIFAAFDEEFIRPKDPFEFTKESGDRYPL
jgi:hypothetical protein